MVGFLIFSHEVEHSVTPVVGGGVKTSDSDIMTSAVAKQPQTCLFQNQIGKNINFSKLGQLRRKLYQYLTGVVAMELQTMICSRVRLD